MARHNISVERRTRLLAWTNGRCWYCGLVLAHPSALSDVGWSGLRFWTIDHVRPLSRGGTRDPSNLVPACARCNGGKGALTLGEYRTDVDAYLFWGEEQGLYVQCIEDTHRPRTPRALRVRRAPRRVLRRIGRRVRLRLRPGLPPRPTDIEPLRASLADVLMAAGLALSAHVSGTDSPASACPPCADTPSRAATLPRTR